MAYNPLPAFLQEAEELIADIEESALTLESGQQAPDAVNRLFRGFHTIKGSGAMCGLTAVAGFTHHVEDLLDRVRAGSIAVSPALTKLVLRATDHIKTLLRCEQGGAPPPAEAADGLLAEIATLVDSGQAPKENGAAPENWLIRFQPNPSLLENGGNPSSLFCELAGLGPCEVVAHTGAVPALDAIQSGRCYLSWNITVRTDAGENAIRDVFLFVEGESTLEIRKAPGAGQKTRSSAAPAAGTVAAAGTTAIKTRALEATVRVPAERLDRLVNLVGELVMNHSCLAQAASQTTHSEFASQVQVLERLVGELRENVLGIRMLPIGSLFGRFRRVVHDLSAELGKEVDLVTCGAETELDKSILDQLGDPLVHCLRNCLDHGAEPAAERERRGKPRRATIRLAAVHTGSNVVITIEDDGRGINRDAVRAKAVEKQLIAADSSLTDRELLNLILIPGFSTARQVTSVSGRGVGMDAVKRQVDALRGSLSLESRKGEGTRVSISLPLTLAIIEGLLVQIGAERFILPLAEVTENVELNREERTRNNGRNLLAVRGELVPYIDLRQIFRVPGKTPELEKIVIVQQGNNRIGLVVERVLGAYQTVIQSLGHFYNEVHVFSGATIMGDGGAALILDVAGLVRHANARAAEETE